MEVLSKWSLSYPGKSLGCLIQGFLQCALNTENLIPKAEVGAGGGALLRSERVWHRFASMLPTELWVSSNLLAGSARGL